MAFGAITLGMLSFNSCKKEDPIADPSACFTVSGTLEVGESNLFSNCSNDASEYTWHFGDGTTSKSTDPSHVYYSPGTYIVQLNSYNEEGVSRSESKTITIADKVPVNMIINSITVVSWHQTNNGAYWDADIYPDLNINFRESIWRGIDLGWNFHYENCTPSNTYVFGSNIGFPVLINSLDIPCEIDLYDYDVLTYDDLMGSINFTPRTYHVYGENSINISVGELSFLLDVRWIY